MDILYNLESNDILIYLYMWSARRKTGHASKSLRSAEGAREAGSLESEAKCREPCAPARESGDLGPCL